MEPLSRQSDVLLNAVACRPDSTGANWFQCANGTIGCPYIHNGRTPHCIACGNGTPCEYRHDPPVLETEPDR